MSIKKHTMGESQWKNLAEFLEEGIIVFSKDDLEILYFNSAAGEMMGVQYGNRPEYLTDVLEQEEIDALKRDRTLEAEIGDEPALLNAVEIGQHTGLVIESRKNELAAQDLSAKAIALNNELLHTFSEYGDDTLMIVNREGIIEFAGEGIYRTCGMEPKKFIGRSVYDMEEKGIFSPSVSARIIETGQPQAILQKTRRGAEVLSVGAPILDDNGLVDRVVSLTRDYTKQIELSRLIGELKGSPTIESEDDQVDRIVTCSDKMFEIKAMCKLVAPTDATVMISGETGTGKEVLAQYIASHSNRSDKPFIKVNCGSIASSIAESELFGYEEGAFTGASKGGKKGLIEAANGGTLFLDEIGELPMEQQVKLLHVLQEKTLTRVGGVKSISLDLRVIAATNRNLEEEVNRGSFREDLYYRLNIIPIEVPPLRERSEDVSILTKFFLSVFCSKYSRTVTISRKAYKALEAYSWPGNVRQLENTIERLVLTAAAPTILAENLPPELREGVHTDEVHIKRIMRLDEAVEMVERELIEAALKEYRTTAAVAEVLGVNQSTISRKMSQYGIKKEKQQ